MIDAIKAIRDADRDESLKKSLFARFEANCYLPKRSVLLWNGCVRQRHSHYRWPQGFKERWRSYRNEYGEGNLIKARSNGPPRSSFTVAGGHYVKGNELAHLYSESELLHHKLDEGSHFTQSANLICVSRSHHLSLDRSEGSHDLWLLRGLSFLRFRYDPLGVFNGAALDTYGFAFGSACYVLWP